MSLVSAIISEIRAEVDDGSSIRWSDDEILPFVKKALRRADNLVIKYGLEFGKSSTTLTVLEDANTVALPSDFKRDIGLYCDNKEIPKLSTHDFETALYGSFWRVNGANIELMEAVDSDTNLTLWYFPLTDYSAYTTSSTMPWAGKLDDIIVNYTALLLMNVDEYSVEADMALAKELEKMVLDVYQPLTATLQSREGYIP